MPGVSFPAAKNSARDIYFALRSQADSTTFKASPTLAAGDFKHSGDGSALTNVTTLPTVTPAAGKQLKWAATAAEMNYDSVSLLGSDAAGAEWMDLLLVIRTSTRQVDDLATSTALATAQTDVTAVKAKTDNLPSDPADASDIATSFAGVNTKLDTIDDLLDTEVAAIKAKTDNLPADPADASDIAASFSAVNTKLDTIDDLLDTEVAAIKAKTDNLPTDPADASDIAASFTSLANTLATIAGYLDTEVAAIKAKTDNLPPDPADASDVAASMASLASTLTTVLAAVDTEVAAIKAKTDNLPAAPAAVGDIPTAAQNADKLLGRNIAGGSDGGRTVTSAVRKLRNRVAIASGVMTVYQEDDATADHTEAVTTAAGNPIVSTDPVS